MRKLTATSILLIAGAVAAAQPVYLYRKVGQRNVVLIVKRETTERLGQNRLTDADRKEIQDAQDVALGVNRTQPVSCTGIGRPELPHEDLERWLRCPVQNIGKDLR